MLVVAVAVVSITGLVAEAFGRALGWSDAAVELFSLSYERNVPTWFASALLVLAGALLAVSAQRAARDALAWGALSGVFFFMSLDEAIEIHEHLGALVRGHGVLYFGWVVPGAAIVAVVGLLFLRFYLRLEPVDRRHFTIAAVLYVGGALGMELPLGWWTERAGDDNVVYGLLDWAEETLELAGALWFVLSLRARLARQLAS